MLYLQHFHLWKISVFLLEFGYYINTINYLNNYKMKETAMHVINKIKRVDFSYTISPCA